jgi:hypothetical protein
MTILGGRSCQLISPACPWPPRLATSPSATGSWAALGPVSDTVVSVAEPDGKQIVVPATCQFSFTGTNI